MHAVAKGRMSAAITGGIDIIGEILSRQKTSSSALNEETATIEEEDNEPKPKPKPKEEAKSPPLAPLEPIVIIERQSMSDEEEAEKNIIVVDGNAGKREEAAAAEVRVANVIIQH